MMMMMMMMMMMNVERRAVLSDILNNVGGYGTGWSHG